LDVLDVVLDPAGVDLALLALGAAHGDDGTVGEGLGGVPGAHHGGDAQLARLDRRLAGGTAAVLDARRGALHRRFPVRVGHVGAEHVAGLHALHLGGALDHAHDAGRDLRAHGAPHDEGLAAALRAVAGEDPAGAALHRLGPGLHDVDEAVLAVLDPLDVHRPAVVVLD